MPPVPSLRRVLRERAELATVVGALVFITAFASLRRGELVPSGIVALGLVGGAVLALHAVGIALVYRANRVINFSQLHMGAFAGVVFYEMVTRRVVVRGVQTVCPPCVPAPETVGQAVRALPPPERARALQDPALRSADVLGARLADMRDALPFPVDLDDLAVGQASGWLLHLNFLVSVIVAVGIATLLVWAVYALVIKRFTEAPRFVLTVVTIAAGSLVFVMGQEVMGFVFPSPAGGEVARFGDAVFPFAFHFNVGAARLSAPDVLLVGSLAAVCLWLFLYFRKSPSGRAMRAVAENPQRAGTMGINAAAVVGQAWLIAGFLSGLTTVLVMARSGGSADGYEQLVRVLAGAAVGGLVGIPGAIAGAMGIGLLDQVMLWGTGADVAGAVAVLGVIVLVLLAQHRRASRADVDAQASWPASRELRPIPAELRRLPVVRKATWVLTGLGVLVLLGYPWFMSASQVVQGITTMCFAVIGLSVLILTGWAGQISLAQVGFAGVGAWTAGVLGWPLPLALPAGACAGAAAAAVVGIPALRLRGQHLAISTLALSVAISGVLLGDRYLGKYLPKTIERPMLLGVDFEDDRAFYYLTLFLTAAAVVATMGMRRSRTARALIAAKENERAAQSFGINLLAARMRAFAIAGFLAAMAGVMLAYTQHGVIQSAFIPSESVRLFLVALIGGLGSVAGPLLGALYLGLLNLAAGTPFERLANVLLHPAVGILVLLVVMPGGLAHAAFTVRDGWLRRVASRHRIVVPSLIADTDVNALDEVVLPPKLSPSGRPVRIPERYRLSGQWGTTPRLVREPVDG